MEHILYRAEFLGYQSRIVQPPWFGFDHDDRQLYPVAFSLRQYAQNRGWSGIRLNQIEKDPCSFGITGLALLQSMLFFGVWESISGKAMSSRNFIVRQSADLRLCSINLRVLIQQIIQTLRSHGITASTNLAALQSKAEQIFAVLEEVESRGNVILMDNLERFAEVINVLRRQAALAKDALGFVYGQIPR